MNSYFGNNTQTNTFGNSASTLSRAIPVILFAIGLIALYYLYQFLFNSDMGNSYTILKGSQSATTDPAKPIIIGMEKLPILYEGGEFTFSTWIYLNNWSYRAGFNKPILILGGSNFDTLRVYLGGAKPKLNVRFHTKEASGLTASPMTASMSPNSTAPTMDSLDNAMRNAVFSTLQTGNSLLQESTGCDLPEIELQRWVNVVVVANGKSVDVYVDGKLARSCILPAFYKVDTAGYGANLLSYGGFGGQIANTILYDTALNPERVYKNYMAGPQPISSFTEWLSSIFSIGVNISIQR